MRLVQITDLHMTPNGNTLHGLEPADRLRQCVADINQTAPDAQLCIATGDLADRGERGAYEMIRTCLDELTMPYCLLVGNHDDRPTFQQAFPEVPSDPNGFVQYSRKVGDDVLLFLDTLEPGGHEGRYCEQRCDWLTAELAAWPDNNVYIFMHHPPFDIGLPGLDVIRLLDASGIENALSNVPQLKHIFFGHVHRPVSGCWRGIPFSASPSTLHQVALDFDAPPFIVYSHERPAYAIIDLQADTTVVHIQDFTDAGPRRHRDNQWRPALGQG